MTSQTNSTSEGISNFTSAQGVGQVYLLYSVSLLLVVTVGALIQSASIYIGLAISEFVFILLPAVVYVRLKRVPVAEALRWRVISPAMAAGGVILGVSGWGVAVGCYLLLSPVLGKEPDFGHLTPTTSLEFLWLLVSGALLAGICEESLFRGAIQGTLERLGPVRAVLYSALLFAVFHVNPWSLVPAFLMGLAFGILVVRTGSTIPAILAHISSNTTAFTISYAFRNQPESAIYPLVGMLAMVFAIAFPLYLLRAGRHATIPALLSKVPSDLSRRTKWATASVCAVVPVVALAFVGAHTVASDALEPDLEQGNRVIVLKGHFLALTIDPGDIITFQRDRRTYLRKVTRVDNHDVWVSDESSELKLARQDVRAKVIYKIRLDK